MHLQIPLAQKQKNEEWGYRIMCKSIVILSLSLNFTHNSLLYKTNYAPVQNPFGIFLTSNL